MDLNDAMTFLPAEGRQPADLARQLGRTGSQGGRFEPRRAGQGVYHTIAGEHPDWAEYRRAMIADRRVVVRITPDRAAGRLG